MIELFSAFSFWLSRGFCFCNRCFCFCNWCFCFCNRCFRFCNRCFCFSSRGFSFSSRGFSFSNWRFRFCLCNRGFFLFFNFFGRRCIFCDNGCCPILLFLNLGSQCRFASFFFCRYQAGFFAGDLSFFLIKPCLELCFCLFLGQRAFLNAAL